MMKESSRRGHGCDRAPDSWIKFNELTARAAQMMTTATKTTMNGWWQPTNSPSSGGVDSYAATRLPCWPVNWRYGASQTARPVDDRWDTDLCAGMRVRERVCVCVWQCSSVLLLLCCWGWCGLADDYEWVVGQWMIPLPAACWRCSKIHICCCYSKFYLWLHMICGDLRQAKKIKNYNNKKQIMSAYINFSFQ